MALPWLIGAAVVGAAAAFKKTCKECGGSYWIEDYGKYCSRECRNRARRRRERIAQEIEEAKALEREKERNYKLREIRDFKEDKREYFQNRHRVSIEFREDMVNIVDKSYHKDRLNRIKALANEIKEIDGAIAMLEERANAVR